MRSRVLSTLVAVAALVAWNAPVLAWTSKEIRDWSVECSNGLTCDMSFADWDAKGLQSVGLLRKGAPNAPLELKLRFAPDAAPDKAPAATYVFAVDGKPVLTVKASELRADSNGSWFVYSDPSKVAALAAAMQVGTAMTVTASGTPDNPVLPVKLSGVKGALLYADEIQGRLERTDALVAKGDKAPPEDAIARDIVSLDDLPDVVRKDFTGEGGACSDLDVSTIGQYQGFELSVGTTRVIVVPCGMGGAYNQPYALYVAYDVIVERISFPYMDNGTPTTMSTAYNVDFDPVKREMTSFFKGRGIGDCGQFYKWRMDADAISLRFVEERAKDDCDEKEGGPETFPLIWKAEP
jgi:hypothetical protein